MLFQIMTIVLMAWGFGCLGLAGGQWWEKDKHEYLYKHTCTHCHKVVRTDDPEDISIFKAKHAVAHDLFYEYKRLYKINLELAGLSDAVV